ncbi:MBL fold metallo-hydrolase [Photobacterium leiognathi]|uniref:MBL fold metallo-hydrolase n=1 Tax=Photobacterium leiognathi TaxID=553611 RepID=UPI0027340760|nr:MBL fold metallo-hydrolase [Photobacterium leiognathi]
MIKIKMYPASDGDAFLVSIKSIDGIKNIIIDMGRESTYDNQIKKDLIELNNKNQKIDLLIITHVDTDHIEGAVKFLKENSEDKIIDVCEVWHNSYRHFNFNKKDNNLKEIEKEQLKEIINQNQYILDVKDESNVTFEHGSTLASLLYGNSRWNKATNGRAISVDNIDTYYLGDVKIKLLSPNDKKLKRLSNHWRKYLNSLSYDFNITQDSLFDDAFELFLRSENVIEYDDENISNKKIKLNDSDVDKLSSNISKDMSPTNGSSISFILEVDKYKLLFLGDSHKDIIIENLKKIIGNNDDIKFDLVKISHHGSKNNTSLELLNLINADKFLISTNGKRHNHPNIETIAMLLKNEKYKEIIFNYHIDLISLLNNNELEKYNNYKIIKTNDISI